MEYEFGIETFCIVHGRFRCGGLLADGYSCSCRMSAYQLPLWQVSGGCGAWGLTYIEYTVQMLYSVPRTPYPVPRTPCMAYIFDHPQELLGGVAAPRYPAVGCPDADIINRV